MNLQEILQQLIAERDKLNIAIAALQGFEAPKRRGRPAKNPLAALAASAPSPAAASTTKRRRPKRTQAQREAQAERMRKYWEVRKKQQAAGAKTKKSAKKRAKKDAKPQAGSETA